jgi:hypothetical protein
MVLHRQLAECGLQARIVAGPGHAQDFIIVAHRQRLAPKRPTGEAVIGREVVFCIARRKASQARGSSERGRETIVEGTFRGARMAN